MEKDYHNLKWLVIMVLGCSILAASNIKSIKLAIILWFIFSIPWFITAYKRRRRRRRLMIDYPTQQENRVDELMRQGQMMMLMGRNEQALQLHEEALDIARQLSGAHPEDQANTFVIAGLLYNIASSLSAIGRPKEAIKALNESEQKYRLVGAAGFRPVDTLLADVLARRGMAKYACGYGASAVLDLNSAISVYGSLFTGRDDDPHHLDFARVLSMNATVLKIYGDPDLAVASADCAIRMYLSKSGETDANPALHKNYLWMAAGVASEIHAAHDRMDLALSADDFAVHSARSLMSSQTWRGLLALALTRKGLHLKANNRSEEAESLLQEGWSLDASAAQNAISEWEGVNSGAEPTKVTVATSLAAAAKELGSARVPHDLTAALTCPAIDVKILTPSQRCRPEFAHAFAERLADIALAILPLMKPEGLRLGLEAHYLFAIASQAQTHAMRYQYSDFGPSWARILLACSRAYEVDGQLAMGLDLASWGGGVAAQLMPFGFMNLELTDLIRKCMEQHGRLLILSGDARAGEEILDMTRKF
jgi:tetratricopeptide (TPR) repeat protein